MPAPATIYEKTVGPPLPERLLILNTRSYVIYPFEATNWTDLRVGFFLSLTQTDPAHPDSPAPPPAMIESIVPPPGGIQPFSEYFSIGVTDRATGANFMGFTNVVPRPGSPGFSLGPSGLVSSDGAIGTTNSNFWRPINQSNAGATVAMVINQTVGVPGIPGSEIHFAQVPAGAGGYATLLTLRFVRDSASSRVITMSVKRDITNHSGDTLFSNDPNTTLLKSQLEAFPTTVQQLGPRELANVPDALFVYWPFRNTRMRIHSLGLLKAR